MSLSQKEFKGFPVAKTTREVSPVLQLARILKSQARRAMQDVTECPENAVPHHLARIQDQLELCRWAIGRGGPLSETSEAVLTCKVAMRAHSLADYVALLEHTRRVHRAPAFLNFRDEQFAEIKNMFSALAGLLQQRGIVDALLNEEENANDIGENKPPIGGGDSAFWFTEGMRRAG